MTKFSGRRTLPPPTQRSVPPLLLVRCWPFPSLLVNWCLWADNTASLIHNSWNTTHLFFPFLALLFHLCPKLSQHPIVLAVHKHVITLLTSLPPSRLILNSFSFMINNQLLLDLQAFCGGLLNCSRQCFWNNKIWCKSEILNVSVISFVHCLGTLLCESVWIMWLRQLSFLSVAV